MHPLHYTYLVKCRATGQVYYGVRTANKVSPIDDLWRIYFTSSKKIKLLIQEYGVDAFDYEIRRVFASKESALAWEAKVLRRSNIFDKQSIWLNRCVSKAIRYKTHPRIGVKLSQETKDKIGVANKGKTRSEAIKLRFSESRRGEKHWAYGKKVPSDTKEKISQANKEFAKTNAFKNMDRSHWKRPAKNYILADREGKTTTVHNLTKFCSDNGLNYTNLLYRKRAGSWTLVSHITTVDPTDLQCQQGNIQDF